MDQAQPVTHLEEEEVIILRVAEKASKNHPGNKGLVPQFAGVVFSFKCNYTIKFYFNNVEYLPNFD